MRYSRLSKVKPGDVVATPILGKGGQVLVRAGGKLTERVIERLVALGFAGVCIEDSTFSDIICSPTVSSKTKFEALQALETMDVKSCTKISESIASEVLEGDGVVRASLDELNSYDLATGSHSFSVAIYAGTLAVLNGYNYDRVKQVVMTALLHDIGKSKVAEEIIKKPGPLTAEEYEEIKKHPTYGYEMLKDLESVDSVVRVSILQHHENSNGSGYPTGLRDEDIYEYAKIIHICDVYDAMISERCYKEAQSPEYVIAYIKSESGKMFNPQLVKIFMRSIAPYPEGCEVLLNTGEKAIVKRVVSDHPTEPIVKLYSGEEIDTHRDGVCIVNLSK